MTFSDLWLQMLRKAPDLSRANAKIEITSSNMEKLMKQAYDKGYAAGKKSGGLFGGIFGN